MKKIEVGFSGGMDSILFSITRNEFFSYEQQKEEIHKKYGGKQYYESRTGLSGDGFLEPEAGKNDLIGFGFYRTDALEQTSPVQVYENNDVVIYGYAPYRSHNGIDSEYPFVLTDGSKFVLLRSYQVKLAISEWGEISGKELSIKYFNEYGERYKKVEFCKREKFDRCPNIARFLEMADAREFAGNLEPVGSFFGEKLNVFPKGLNWYHKNTVGFFDQMWSSDPRTIEGEIVNGWCGTGNGLFWRRRENFVECFMEIKRNELNNGKYYISGETPEFVEYEAKFNVIDWFSQDNYEMLMEKVIAKAKEDFLYAIKRSGRSTKSLMQANPEVVISIEDSFSVGNCESGTRQFMSQYGIETESISVRELLQNENIDRIVKRFDFQKIIEKKCA